MSVAPVQGSSANTDGDDGGSGARGPSRSADGSTPRRIVDRAGIQVVFLVCLCAVLFLTGLGERGLAYSEGHRVGPAWEMLDSGMPWEARDSWLVPRLFGTAYLRKPPGMAWAIAASSAVLGRDEFAARVPSAVAMTVLVLVAWRVTTRWVGSPWGVAAGMAQALFPLLWSSARAAEIEMVHAAGAGAGALLIADTMLRTDRHRWMSALGAGLGVAVMVLAKGPAGAPVVLAAPIGVCLARRSIGAMARPALALVLVVPGIVLGATAWGMYDALDRLQGPVITQGVGEFLWEPSKILRIVTLPAAAFGSMCPAALALIVALWRPRRDAAPVDAHAETTGDIASRSLALAWVVAIVLYTAMGVSNPRYTLPAAALLPPMVAWALAGMVRSPDVGGFVKPRRGLARLLALGSAWTWAVVLAGGFVGFVLWYETPRGRTSGDIPGAALAAILERDAQNGATVWADELVECRPEVLLYARKWTPLLRVRWSKPLEDVVASPGDILIVRTDRHALPEGAPTERDRCAPSLAGATLVHRFDVHKYSFEVYRVRPPVAVESAEPTAPPSP